MIFKGFYMNFQSLNKFHRVFKPKYVFWKLKEDEL
jgi:hypothetical protein